MYLSSSEYEYMMTRVDVVKYLSEVLHDTHTEQPSLADAGRVPYRTQTMVGTHSSRWRYM